MNLTAWNPGSRVVELSNHAEISLNPSEVAREYEAVMAGAGVRFLGDRLIVRVIGDDRVSFLHGMCTADIKGLKPGFALPALILTEHAHVITDLFIYAVEGDALMLEVERAGWPSVRAHLEKFLVADDVEMEEVESLGVVDIEGALARDVVQNIASGAAELPPWQHINDGGTRVANLPRFGGPACTIIAERNRIAELITELKRLDPTICDMSAETLEIIRVEHGLARVGVDTSEKTLALEARLERAISFNKGCYIGQETIERATARGALKRRLYGLRIEGTRVPQSGAAVLLDGREVGRLGSIVRSPAEGIIGLAILHHSAWVKGTRVRVQDPEGESAANVVDLPFRESQRVFK